MQGFMLGRKNDSHLEQVDFQHGMCLNYSIAFSNAVNELTADKKCLKKLNIFNGKKSLTMEEMYYKCSV